jgi:hypothetical protein
MTRRQTPAPGQAELFSLTQITGQAAAPQLPGYDVILVNISGGKDSQAILDITVHAADAAGVRSRVAVFADLGAADEWPGTAELGGMTSRAGRGPGMLAGGR